MSTHSIYRNCPICQNDTVERLYSDIITSSIETFGNPRHFVSCSRCGFVYVDMHFPPQFVETFYADYLVSEPLREHGPTDPSFVVAPTEVERERFSPITEFAKQYCDSGATILDIGCGHGALLQLLSESGFTHLTGMDMSHLSLRNCRSLGFNALYGRVDDPTTTEKWDQQYDFVVMLRLLEHIVDLSTTMETLKKIVKPGGYIAIDVPDTSRYANHPEINFLPIEHLSHFDQLQLNRLFASYGFEPIETILTGGDNVSFVRDNGLVVLFRRMRDKMQEYVHNVTFLAECRNHFSRYIQSRTAWCNDFYMSTDHLFNSSHEFSVWGLGKTFSEIQVLSSFDHARIKHYIDSNPQKKGKAIFNGFVETPEALINFSGPILVNGITQRIRDSICEHIRTLNITSEVIMSSAKCPTLV